MFSEGKKIVKALTVVPLNDETKIMLECEDKLEVQCTNNKIGFVWHLVTSYNKKKKKLSFTLKLLNCPEWISSGDLICAARWVGSYYYWRSPTQRIKKGEETYIELPHKLYVGEKVEVIIHVCDVQKQPHGN